LQNISKSFLIFLISKFFASYFPIYVLILSYSNVLYFIYYSFKVLMSIFFSIIAKNIFILFFFRLYFLFNFVFYSDFRHFFFLQNPDFILLIGNFKCF